MPGTRGGPGGDPLPARDEELLLHEIDAGHGLGHRMLHLDSRVQLEEEEILSLDDELDGPGPDVTELSC